MLGLDPMFGLPCMTDSKAMDEARNRNQIQEKMLSQKFEALDLDLKLRSSKLLSQKGDIEHFKAKLDSSKILLLRRMPKERSKHQKMFQKAGTMSISLVELNHRLAEKKNRMNNIFANNVETESDTMPKTFQNRENKFNKDGLIISSPKQPTCLTLSRKKQAVRDTWNRLRSEDTKYKERKSGKNITLPSVSSTVYKRKKLKHGPIDKSPSLHYQITPKAKNQHSVNKAFSSMSCSMCSSRLRHGHVALLPRIQCKKKKLVSLSQKL